MKIIIIGAGPAGLTAAYEILGRTDEHTVEIYESSDRIGGISQTVRYKNRRMDLGGHRFFSKIDRVNEMWDEILPVQGEPSRYDKLLGCTHTLAKGGPAPDSTDEVMLKRTRVSRIYFKNKFFDYPISAKVFGQMGFYSLIKAGFSYLHSCFFKLPEDNLENFYINRFGRVLYSMFFEGYTEKLWGRHPSEISADWGAQRVKGLSVLAVAKDMLSKAFGKKDTKETSLIGEFSYPKYGPGQFWECTAEKVVQMGGIIHKNCCVKKIVTENGAVKSVEFEKDGEFFSAGADIVISSMPVKDLIGGMNAVPEDIRMIADGLPYRDFMTIGVLVDKLKIKNTTKTKTLGNIVPDCWIYVQDTDVKMGRIQIFNNWSPYLVDDPENSVWLGLEYFCAEGDELWTMSDADFAKLAAAELVKTGIISDCSDIKDSHIERVKKAYPAYFDTYSEFDKIKEYLDSFDNLYCIGRNGQHRYNNMDHSMMTAFETADNILGHKQGKENIWSVNTEKEYHETKKEI
ncbi:MAG: NAD(P)/FAD-dependent oxidoreductase [Oscillospiraceae bacterium]